MIVQHGIRLRGKDEQTLTYSFQYWFNWKYIHKSQIDIIFINFNVNQTRTSVEASSNLVITF